MKSVLRRTWAPLLAVSLVQLAINSRPVSLSGGIRDSDLIAKAILFLALFLATSFIGGAVHAGILRRRTNSGLTVSLLDGGMIGLLSNLMVHMLSSAMHGSSLDLLVPPGGADPIWWIWKLVLSFVILMIFGFMGLLSGGVGGGAGYLVSTWMACAPTIGEKRD